MRNNPPKIAERILEKLLYDDVWKSTLGDFEEYYTILFEERGKLAADRWYWRQVFRYAPSKIIHKLYWSIEMFLNYLKIAHRNIQKNKGYSFINIFGLGVGLASFLLLAIYIQYERSYDSFHEDSDRIYRVVREVSGEVYMGSPWFGVNPLPLSLLLADNFQGVEESTAFYEHFGLVKGRNGTFFEEGISTDTDFFEIFNTNWIIGNAETAFNDPASVVITQSFAKKYFGDQNPMGQTLEFEPRYYDPILRKVSGVIADWPGNSQVELDFIVPQYSLDDYDRESVNWLNNNFYSYIKIFPETSTKDLALQFEEIVHPKLLEIEYFQNNPQNLPSFDLIPANEVHLRSGDINFNPGTIGDIRYVRMLSAIALLILIIACVNYMNLATARSMNRAKEVGVRKVNGAFRSNIMMQFSAEAIIFSFLSILFAFVILIIALPYFTEIVNREIDLSLLINPIFIVFLLTLGLGVGIISGSYPAVFMAALRPIGIFKNQMKGGSGNKRLRNFLVIGQFAITNILIIGSIVIYQQLNFIKSSDAGYNREQVLSVSITDTELFNNYDVLKQNLLSNSNIITVSTGDNLPNFIDGQTGGTFWDGKEEDEILRTFTTGVSVDYIELLDIELISGAHFAEQAPRDTLFKYILNERMIASLGWDKDEAIGEYFRLWRRDGEVVGVVKDFNYQSYHMGIEPLVLRLEPPNRHDYLILKLSPGNFQETLTYIEEQIAVFSPDYPFEYAFLDDVVDTMYQNELTLGKIFNYFSILALIVACMGLFGLAAFMMEQRTKEIGVRKVLGANTFQIITLLNKDFLKLVAISFGISIPFGWFIANSWLENFAYRISIGPAIFIITGFIAFGIALITVSYKSVKTAFANPVNSLKSE